MPWRAQSSFSSRLLSSMGMGRALGSSDVPSREDPGMAVRRTHVKFGAITLAISQVFTTDATSTARTFKRQAATISQPRALRLVNQKTS